MFCGSSLLYDALFYNMILKHGKPSYFYIYIQACFKRTMNIPYFRRILLEITKMARVNAL
jgi:hypothetical protein